MSVVWRLNGDEEGDKGRKWTGELRVMGVLCRGDGNGEGRKEREKKRGGEGKVWVKTEE